jgi:hypothetical protein
VAKGACHPRARRLPQLDGHVHSALRDPAQVLRRHWLLQVGDAHLRGQAQSTCRALLLREYILIEPHTPPPPTRRANVIGAKKRAILIGSAWLPLRHPFNPLKDSVLFSLCTLDCLPAAVYGLCCWRKINTHRQIYLHAIYLRPCAATDLSHTPQRDTTLQ